VKAVSESRDEDGKSTQMHTKEREEDNGAQRMTGQHSGCQGCFYMHRGYIIIVLQKSQPRSISLRRVKEKGSPYGDCHRRGNQRAYKSVTTKVGVVLSNKAYQSCSPRQENKARGMINMRE